MKKMTIATPLYTFITLLLICLSLSFIACKKDNSPDTGISAVTSIKITDSPVDDAAVSGAFVTITDIKLDGQSVQGFTKTTIDLLAYQNGSTTTLGTFNLSGKTYSTISFVLDFDTDASGNAPGCYVLSPGSIKHKLQSTSNTITVTKSFTLQAASSNAIVADFDLRKMIIHQPGGADKYDFATSEELQHDVRLVVENQTGNISGNVTDLVSGSSKIVAYAYKKGTFNRSIELSGQGASNVEFSNAVTSSVAVSGITAGSYQYQLHFLEAGLYEVYFASYKDTNADGIYELQGTLIVTVSGGLDLLNIDVKANTTFTVNATATGVLP